MWPRAAGRTVKPPGFRPEQSKVLSGLCVGAVMVGGIFEW